MSKIFIRLMMVSVAAFFIGTSYAQSIKTSLPADTEKECGVLKINIVNKTGKVCLLNEHRLMHGQYLIYLPSYSIDSSHDMSNPAMFYVRQTGYGPDVGLIYNCGGKIVNLNAQQNFCYLKAGQMNVSWASDSIQVNQTVSQGAYPGKAGNVTWILNNKS